MEREVCRQVFASVIETKGRYVLLNDGYYVTTLKANNDTEAKTIFDKWCKRRECKYYATCGNNENCINCAGYCAE